MVNFKIILLLAICGFTRAKLINLSCKQIRAFVDGHNARRLQLVKGQVPGQPPASDMKLMMWDNELEAKAAKWASRNHFAHNPDKTIGSHRFHTGENLYWYATTDLTHKLDVESSLRSWFDEHLNYSYGPLTMRDFNKSSKKQIGHYTQMAWANTMYVGCAISQYTKNNFKEFLVVCNYGPGGNYIGQKPYESRRRHASANALICGAKNCSQRYGDRC
ncbi:Venom allergen 5 [Papilio machaon]|uniref:Venom allergen 5 n=1 Tax=Papilio machaon TaxID=76193 RepID=A0A194RQ07_PAPMA|nr:Venom allergen 5 [Papilio machaon]